VNLTLEGLVGQCIPGAKILDVSEFGHTVMEAQAAKLYTKKVDGKLVDRGVAFPICISVNDIVCNHSPLATEETVGTSFWVVCCVLAYRSIEPTRLVGPGIDD
jgi:methionine aminopeptidase